MRGSDKLAFSGFSERHDPASHNLMRGSDKLGSKSACGLSSLVFLVMITETGRHDPASLFTGTSK